MKSFAVTQGETVLATKNFSSYLAEVSLLGEVAKGFKLKVKPVGSSAALRFMIRRMERRNYELGKVSITGRKEVGYSIFVDGIRVGTCFLVGSELIVEGDYSQVSDEDTDQVNSILADVKNIYRILTTRVTTEKITDVVNSYFRKVGATPLRPERGDFYLLKDTPDLRRFVQLIEDRNLNKAVNPHCFILTKVDETTISVLRHTIKVRLESLKRRISLREDNLSKYRSVIQDVRDFRKAVEVLGTYLLTDGEKAALLVDLADIEAKAKRMFKKLNARKGKFTV